MRQDRCPECGALVRGGFAGCQSTWDEISVLAYKHPAYAASRDLAFDTYCMQHPEQYGRSAKSYAAHLTRLCCGMENRGDPAIYAAIRQWFDGQVEIEKPPLVRERGHLTVLHVGAAHNVGDHKRLVQEWAESVWDAYREQHELARNWISTALEADTKAKRGQRHHS